MAPGPKFSRRRLLTGAGCSALAGAVPFLPAVAQVTDLRGLDALWRNAEDAVTAFFGNNVKYSFTGLDLDLPEHADVGSSVPMTIRIDCAMTEEDYPRVVHIVAHGNPTPHVMSAWFLPASGKAEFNTRIRLEKSQKVTAVAQMSDGRHLRMDREISVSFGACAQIGTGGNDDIFAFQPQTRVSVQPTAHRGDVIPIRALISHPMETGLRLDSTDEWVRKRIISSFDCKYQGASVFRARLYPAIATNPYFLFHARAQDSGIFDFVWYDMIDMTFKSQAKITIV